MNFLAFGVWLASVGALLGQVMLPEIRQQGGVKQLFVDNKPFVMLAGELHNSTASGLDYLRPVLDHLKALHVNTVISTVSWELMEPAEGRFDFSLVDGQIVEARRRNLRLVLIWFGTYKTALSSYVPAWVKADRKRFPAMVRRPPSGRGPLFPIPGLLEGDGGIGALSPLGEETLRADAKAYRALMRHLREFDPQHTVIMMQVENEPGSFGDSRDRSALAEAAWAKPVPAALMNYLVRHEATLLPELKEIWLRHGAKHAGTWAEVFGSDEWGEEVFMAYYAARFTGAVAAAGKEELNLPTFVNAFLAIPGKLPGEYPSGGPTHKMIDIYHAAAPALDVLSPNAYSPDFKGICALYARAGNPLLIPETGAVAGNLFWAIGHHAALAWAPFGSIETLPRDGQIAQAYGLLQSVMPQLTKWQAEGKVDAILVTEKEQAEPLKMGGYAIRLAARARGPQPPAPPPAAGVDGRPFAIVVHLGPDEFLFLGGNGVPHFQVDSPGAKQVAVAIKEEGRYRNGQWAPGRRLNGDEAGHGLPEGSLGMLRIQLVRFD
jgi:hypothetical protein